MKKRVLGSLLALFLLVNLLPGAAFGAGSELEDGMAETKPAEGSSASMPGVSAVNRAGGDRSAADVFTWDAETKTLTVYDIEQYAGAHKEEVVHLVIDIGEQAIPDSAFQRCNALQSLEVRACGDIGKSAFHYCPALTRVQIQKCGNIAAAFGAGFISSSGGINNVAEALTTVEIGTCGDIGTAAFQNCKALQSVVIQECTLIKMMAFSSCSALKDLSIVDCGEIADMAFFACNGVEQLMLDGCNKLGDSLFGNGAKGLKELTLRNIGELADNVFAGASNLEVLTLDNCPNIGISAFARCKNLRTLTVKNIEEIGSYMLQGAGLLESICLEGVKRIGTAAFQDCSSLKEVRMDEDVAYIGANAFDGTAIEHLDVPANAYLGYSDIFANMPQILERIEAILDGQFYLDAPQTVEEINADGWTSVQSGKENSSQYGGTQLTKEARWADGEKTIADVQVKAYFSPRKQMDFVFVADASNSMTGGSDGLNANFYTMQSKLIDVSQVLLEAGEDYDCRVAYVSFGETESEASGDFFSDPAAAKAYVESMKNYGSNTNYAAGLGAQALALVEANQAAGRATAVIFISDGEPKIGETIPEKGHAYYGTAEAAALKAAGAQIIGVLQSNDMADAEIAMGDICDRVFSSTDTQGFSQAVNDAIRYALNSHTLVDTVHPDFELDADSIEVSGGEIVIGTDDEGNTTITWTMTEPFVAHTLRFQEKLRPNEGGSFPYGDFDTNALDAPLVTGGDPVNRVATPVLPRRAPDPGPVYTSLTVIKTWVLDDGGTAADAVVVELLCNGRRYATAELNAANNWTHTFTQLSAGNDWTVAELDCPEGFTSEISRRGAFWTITNDDVAEETPVDPDEPPDEEDPSEPETPPEEPEGPVLPQTGQHWWPVWLLLGGSALSLSIGALIKKRGHETNKK